MIKKRGGDTEVREHYEKRMRTGAQGSNETLTIGAGSQERDCG